MKDSKTIIDEVNKLLYPNAGVKALAKKAKKDPCFCIMDEESCGQKGYRDECPDSRACHNQTFMMACLQTRRPEMLGLPAIQIYSKY